MKRSELILYWFITPMAGAGHGFNGHCSTHATTGRSTKIFSTWLSCLLDDHFGSVELLGTVAILIPGRMLLKEWAYAGFSLLCRELPFHTFVQGTQ